MQQHAVQMNNSIVTHAVVGPMTISIILLVLKLPILCPVGYIFYPFSSVARSGSGQ